MLRESLIQFKAICDIQKSVFATIKDIDDKNTTLLASVNNLKQSVDIKLNSYKSSVQDELKENQKNNIQILAIFSGIVMFVSGSIQIFQHAESFKDAAMFMLLFAASLSLFALLIYALFSNGKQIKLLMLSVILAIILISCIGVFGWCDNIVGLLIKSQLVHIG
jgi:multidrug efflux pump subunit AcrB